MEDEQIVDLYWKRSEAAIRQTERKYGRYCRAIAYNILSSDEDSRECVNDTWLKAWSSMPPQRPVRLQAFLGKITRNIALDRYRRKAAGKRSVERVGVAFEELSECLPAMPDEADRIVEGMALTQVLDRFLTSLSEDSRRMFMRRYWYFSSIKEIARDLGVTEGKVKMSLLRARMQLRDLLEKEGVSL